jgi:Zn ribbon nucleic-acid-binding protein
MDGFICPKCGKRTMKKKEKEPGVYKLVCLKCGFEHNELPSDDKLRGFV